MKKSLPISILAATALLGTLAVCGACGASGSKAESPEVLAARMLDTARMYLHDKLYQEARATIFSMREKHPTAFEARTKGIIVMDSIELGAARDSLAVMDSVLQAEKAVFAAIEAKSDARKRDEFYDQRAKVFRLTQETDMMAAKVKFYLRKLDVDMVNDHH